ncbi:hypothetical protein A5666_22785 [Mycolicibacterium fortuitum]|uniref:DUF4760 domain-containing protein n=1 Tax=Mycolicibacterium fortuitum TaxID=1766 RepID=UPI0007EACE7F|nr:hypothetical protein [Mycolicibacterium fortuitum]OBA98272.1 hypothetical protein A5665_25705 [Mycolicibacterium fortuitum]OBI70667.1 hypothetical protein A5666_22785 [Mycolicibacterium fortuitum]
MATDTSFIDWAIKIFPIAISVIAIAVSVFSYQAARHNVSTKVLVDMFKEHRSAEFAETRRFVHRQIDPVTHPHNQGFGAFGDMESRVRDLAWFYDNLGVLVHHGTVSVGPVSGYLGGSVSDMWNKLEPYIQAERSSRSASVNPERWQIYFELLNERIRVNQPTEAIRARPFSASRRAWFRVQSKHSYLRRLRNESGTVPSAGASNRAGDG